MPDDDDQGIKPLVIDTSTTAAFQEDSTDQTASAVGSAGHTAVEPDAAQSTELCSTSQSSPVLPLALPAIDSEFCDDEEDDRGEYEQLAEHHHDESMSSDSQSTIGSSNKDLTGSMWAGDLSPGSGTTARCSKSRRKADRVRTITVIFIIYR